MPWRGLQRALHGQLGSMRRSAEVGARARYASPVPESASLLRPSEAFAAAVRDSCKIAHRLGRRTASLPMRYTNVRRGRSIKRAASETFQPVL